MKSILDRLFILTHIFVFTITLHTVIAQSHDAKTLVEIYQKIEQKKNWFLISEPEFYFDEELDLVSEELTDYLGEYQVIAASKVSYLFSKDSLTITLQIFVLPSQIHAFGFYSIEKSPSLDFFDIGFESYAIGERLVCWYGNYVFITEPEDTLEEQTRLLRDFTSEMVKILDRQKRQTPILDCLPEKNRVEHSEKFFLGRWLGQDYFNNIYYADYNTEEGYSRIFIIDNEITASSDTSFWNYFYFFKENVEVILDTLEIDTDYYVINEPLWGKTIMAKKNQIIYGILDYRNKEWTEERLAEVLDALKKRKIVKPG